MARFQHLFSPLNLRGVEVRNRILSTGHQTYLARGGLISAYTSQGSALGQ